MDGFDPWQVLGVEPGASDDEVRRAWRDLARRFHPDGYGAATDEERGRAAAHMTAVNVAYEEIRSGRARQSGRRTSAPPRPPAGGPEPWSGPSFDAGWLDEEVLAEAERRLRRRRDDQRRRRRRRWLMAALVAGLVLLAAHLSLSRSYGYDLVYDGQGNSYADVDCGDGYDRGRTTADALREQARVDRVRAAELVHQAAVVEEVCGQWLDSARFLLGPFLLITTGALWLFLIRRP